MAAHNRFLPRKMPRQSRSKANFEAILDAAARVLVKEGYDRATTNRIADVAGVGIGTLYEYFPNKEAVFAALRRRMNEEGFVRLVEAADRSNNVSPREMIELIVQARIDVVLQDPVLHCALNDQIPHYVTQDQTDEMLQLFLKVALEFLTINQEVINDGRFQLMAELAMRATYAVIEDTVLFAPEKLREPEYNRELKELICRYLLKSIS